MGEWDTAREALRGLTIIAVLLLLAPYASGGSSITTRAGSLYIINDTGSTHLFINTSNGNLGIGTTNPAALFHLNKSQNTATYIRVENLNNETNASTNINFYRDDGAVATYGLASSQYIATAFRAATLYTNATQGFLLYTAGAQANITFHTNATEKMRITGAGNVGIGTTSPSGKLTVNDTTSGATINLIGRSTDDTASINFRTTTDASTYAYIAPDTNEFRMLHSDGNMTMYTGGSERVRVTSDGNLGIGTTTPARQLHVHQASGTGSAASFTDTSTGTTSSDGLYVGYSTNAYIWNYENTNLGLATNNTERVTIKNDGNVGIGTSTPNSQLHVIGEANISGISGDGTGKVVCIKSDGNLGTCSSAVGAGGTCTCG